MNLNLKLPPSSSSFSSFEDVNLLSEPTLDESRLDEEDTTPRPEDCPSLSDTEEDGTLNDPTLLKRPEREEDEERTGGLDDVFIEIGVLDGKKNDLNELGAS